MDKYLIKYLRDNADNELSKKYIDFFKVELDCLLYISETVMSKSYHRDRKIEIREKLVRFYQYFYTVLNKNNFNSVQGSKVLSTVHFPIENTISDLGFELQTPVWHPLGKSNIYGDLKTIKWHNDIQNRVRHEDFHSFLDPEFHNKLEEFQKYLLLQYQKQDFRALFLYTDQYFYSKYSIDIFKKMDRPSFVFQHGMPAYTLEVDNRSDYLMVWSDKIKQNYIDVGFERTKIKVVGHPKYKKLPKEKVLRSDLSDVLVTPLTSATWIQHDYDNTVITDSSMTVLYLYKVQTVLKKLGVKKARYRTHPTMNKKWVHSFLDQEFYICDTEALTVSLSKASLVIGVNSTILLDSLIHGVNYILFDPIDENKINMGGHKASPPFDGSDEKLLLANDESQLENMLRSNVITDYSIIHDYIQDLDLSVLRELID